MCEWVKEASVADEMGVGGDERERVADRLDLFSSLVYGRLEILF